MLTAMASDHGGFLLKADLVTFVRGLGHEVADLGCFDEGSVDYPDLGQAARLAKEHNNVNVLVMGGRIVGPGLAREMVKEWLEAELQGERHLRRLQKIEALERRNFQV